MIPCAEYEGEEYEVLLRFVSEQAERAKTKKDDSGDEDDEDTKYVRKWYAPWKKVKIEGKAKKVSERSSPGCAG